MLPIVHSFSEYDCLFLSVTHSLVLRTHCRLTHVLLTGWIVITVVLHLWICETSAEGAHPISTAAEKMYNNLTQKSEIEELKPKGNGSYMFVFTLKAISKY